MAKKKKLNTTITSRGGCGFAQSGRYTYIENAHKKKSYQVLVRAHFKYDNGRQGHNDNLYVVPPKGEVGLGCSCTNDTGGTVTRFVFEIMNETEMK